MGSTLRDLVLPPGQRRSLPELLDDLQIGGEGHRDSGKRSAYWTLLVLSAVIASCGLLAGSTATVIGAMIIAPLGGPIMGTAAGLVTRSRTGSLVYVCAGAAVVVLVGFAFSFALPSSFDVENDPEIVGRTSPSLLDLIAAIATGFAGAVGLARRDVAAVLPGVAIAISLVPPLAVVGICVGSDHPDMAAGALLLFVSNLISMILAGTLVFAALGYAGESDERRAGPTRRAKTVVALSLAGVALPLAANTVLTAIIATWEADAQAAVEEWVSDVPDAEVTDTELAGDGIRVTVRSAGDLPPVRDLADSLREIPEGVDVVLVRTPGRTIVVERE